MILKFPEDADQHLQIFNVCADALCVQLRIHQHVDFAMRAVQIVQTSTAPLLIGGGAVEIDPTQRVNHDVLDFLWGSVDR